MAMRWPYIEERFVAKTEHDAAKKTRSDAARKARIRARNNRRLTQAKATRDRRDEAAEKHEEDAAMPEISSPTASIAVDGNLAPRSRRLCRSTSRQWPTAESAHKQSRRRGRDSKPTPSQRDSLLSTATISGSGCAAAVFLRSFGLHPGKQSAGYAAERSCCTSSMRRWANLPPSRG